MMKKKNWNNLFLVKKKKKFPHSNIVQRCICSHKLEDVVLIEVSEGLLEASLCCLKNVQIFLFSFGPPHLHAVQVAEIGHRIFSSVSVSASVSSG